MYWLMLYPESAEREDARKVVEPLEQMLLLVFIPVVWSIVMIVCLSVCTLAARGDAALEREIERPPLPTPRARSSLALRRAATPQMRLLDTRRASR